MCEEQSTVHEGCVVVVLQTAGSWYQGYSLVSIIFPLNEKQSMWFGDLGAMRCYMMRIESEGSLKSKTWVLHQVRLRYRHQAAKSSRSSSLLHLSMVRVQKTDKVVRLAGRPRASCAIYPSIYVRKSRLATMTLYTASIKALTFANSLECLECH
jgi:hypothetical protein